MSFWDTLLTGTASEFADTFGEQVTVGTEGGAERVVYAVVDRSPPEPADGNAFKPTLRITFRNDAVYGVDTSTLNAGKNYVKVSNDVGGAVIKWPLHAKPAQQDAGLITFEL